MSAEPKPETLAALRLLISDPWAVVVRGDNYAEPLSQWSARAVLAAGWVSPEEAAAREAAARREALLEAAHSSECAFDGDAMTGLIDALEEARAKVARAEALAAQWRAEPYPSAADSGWNQGHDVRRESDAYALECALAEPERDEEGGR